MTGVAAPQVAPPQWRGRDLVRALPIRNFRLFLAGEVLGGHVPEHAPQGPSSQEGHRRRQLLGVNGAEDSEVSVAGSSVRMRAPSSHRLVAMRSWHLGP